MPKKTVKKTNEVNAKVLIKTIDTQEPVKVELCEDCEYTITPFISLSDSMQFVEDIADSCAMESGEFHPEIFDFAVRTAVITYYGGVKLPEDIEEQYKIAYLSPIYGQIMEHVNMQQWDNLVSSARAVVNHRMEVVASAAVMKTNELLSSLEKMVETVEPIFSGINPDDINKLVSSLTSGKEINEENIFKALIKASK